MRELRDVVVAVDRVELDFWCWGLKVGGRKGCVMMGGFIFNLQEQALRID